MPESIAERNQRLGIQPPSNLGAWEQKHNRVQKENKPKVRKKPDFTIKRNFANFEIFKPERFIQLLLNLRKIHKISYLATLIDVDESYLSNTLIKISKQKSGQKIYQNKLEKK
jgi:hypothetical protein